VIKLPGLRLLELAFGRGGIVAYHGVRESSLLTSTHVTPAALEAQLEFVAGSYQVMPLTEFVARRLAGRSLRGCVAVTFDDAYTGILTYGVRVLERLAMPATVFVASAFCRPGRRFWWDRLEWVMQKLPGAARRALMQGIGLTADAADYEVRDRLLTRFRGTVPRGLDAALRRAESLVGEVSERAMNGDELLQLSRSNLIDFGCHTVHHYALPWLAATKVEREIRSNHDWLRERLPRVRPYLAYPYGLYTATTVEAARRGGMQAAFSIEPRAATSRFPIFYCPRIGMADVNTLSGLRLRLSWFAIPIVAAQNRGWHPRLRPASEAVPQPAS
jgi:peptidoglycan/xylan/chitin deacetylase (PgdA/CDA1 family)